MHGASPPIFISGTRMRCTGYLEVPHSGGIGLWPTLRASTSHLVILRCYSVSYQWVTSFRCALAARNDKYLCHPFEVLRGTL